MCVNCSAMNIYKGYTSNLHIIRLEKKKQKRKKNNKNRKKSNRRPSVLGYDWSFE